MKVFIDCREVINKKPLKRINVLDQQLFVQNYVVKNIELCYYKNLNKIENSIITAIIKIDEREIEIKYREGNFEDSILEDTKELLIKYSGISSLINRALIEIDNN